MAGVKTYATGRGDVTERVRVDLEPDEAAAIAATYEHLFTIFGTDDRSPLLRGLRRIHAAYRIENPNPRREP